MWRTGLCAPCGWIDRPFSPIVLQTAEAAPVRRQVSLATERGVSRIAAQQSQLAAFSAAAAALGAALMRAGFL